MAFFGLFGDDEEQQAAPRKTFFGSIGNFIGGAIKLALIAVAAVLTLGLIFKNDTAKEFADKNLGGLGTGTLNMIEKGWNKTKEFFGFSNTPTPDSLAEIVKVGNRETIIPKKDGLAADPIVANSELRRKLSDRGAAIAEINDPKNTFTAAQKAEKLAALEALPGQSFALADKIEVWNTTARLANEKNSGSGLPTIPTIKLEGSLPVIPEKFNDLGRTKVGGAAEWDNLSTVNKIKILNTAVKEGVANKPDLRERSLKEDAGIFSGSTREFFLPDRVQPMENVTVPGLKNVLSVLFRGNEVITDKGIEINARDRIANLIDKGDLESALTISNAIQEKFQKTAVAIPTNIQNKDGSWMELNPDDKLRAEKQMVLYKNASESFGKISKHIEAKQMERDYEKQIANPTHSAVATVAATIPTQLKDYEQKLANYKSGSNMTVDATTPDDKQKHASNAPIDYGTILAKASHNNEDKDLKTTAPNKKPEKGTGIALT